MFREKILECFKIDHESKVDESKPFDHRYKSREILQ